MGWEALFDSESEVTELLQALTQYEATIGTNSAVPTTQP